MPPTQINMLDLLFCNPWRPVDAWWRRAVGIHESGDPAASPNRDSGQGCGWIKQAQRFCHARGEATSFDQQVQLITDYPAIHYAYQVYEQTGPDTPLRSAIEARILARQTDQEISQACGCWPQYIGAYQALFFNVRDRLNCRDFILNSVLGALATGFDVGNNGLLLKLFGYMGGPHVLDAMISRFPNAGWVNRPEGVSSFFQDLAINSMKQKTAVASMSMPVGSGTYRHLLEAFVKCVEIERTTDSVGTAQDQIQDGLQNLLASFPFLTLSEDKAKELPHYAHGAAELRSDELLQASFGRLPENLDEIMALRFPEPGRPSPQSQPVGS